MLMCTRYTEAVSNKRNLLIGLILLGIAGNAIVWVVYFARPAHALTVSVLDIGQGDSILIQGPTGTQILVDGGPDRSVLRELPKVMGPFDRSLDLVVETHPDADHITGLSYVFDRYAVARFMSPGIPDDTNASRALDAALVREPGLESLIARRGLRIHLGGGAYADVLYPDRDVSKMNTNDGSVVLHIVYGKTAFMLTGDLPSPEEGWLITLDGEDGELISDVLKAGHHGSKYSTDDAWLAAVHPAYVAISAGLNNRYGHPAPETLARIEKEGAEIDSTLGGGAITYVSDGVRVQRK